MLNFSKIANRIKKNEGFKNKIYKDSLGNPTIGYGHLINSKDFFVVNKSYSKKILTNIFKKDFEKAVSDFKNNYDLKKLSTNSQEVIIEMIFQLGIKKTLKFKKFTKYIKKKHYYLAAFEMMKSLWYKQTPNRVNKLIYIY